MYKIVSAELMQHYACILTWYIMDFLYLFFITLYSYKQHLVDDNCIWCIVYDSVYYNMHTHASRLLVLFYTLPNAVDK